MNFTELEYLVAIAEEKQFSKAAKRLFVTQPTLSRSIKRFEERIGDKLFIRKKDYCELTQLGIIYIEFAKTVLHERELLNVKVANFFQFRSIAYGITPSRSTSLSANAVKYFKYKFPDVTIKIVEESVTVLEELFNTHQLDIIFYTDRSHRSRENETLLWSEEIVLTVKKGLFLGKKKLENRRYPWVDIRQLQDETFLRLPKEMRLGQIFDELLKKNGIENPNFVEVPSIDTAQQMAISGVGYCLCSDLNVNSYSDQLDIFSFGEEVYTWDFIAKFNKLDPAIQYLIECFSLSKKNLQI